MTNAAELYLDFHHEDVQGYYRELNLNEAVHKVQYESGGVVYSREYFTSYPDDVLVVRLTADQPGALSFTVRPEIPYPAAKNELDTKSNLLATAVDDLITLSGTIDYYQLNFEVQVKVLNEGGSLNARGDVDRRRRCRCRDDSLLAVDTNYELGPHIFLNDPKEKLDPDLDPHAWVSAKIDAATSHGFDALRERHLADYEALFDRVAVDFGAGQPGLPTHELLANYRFVAITIIARAAITLITFQIRISIVLPVQ